LDPVVFIQSIQGLHRYPRCLCTCSTHYLQCYFFAA
jgi:hypothetical protein